MGCGAIPETQAQKFFTEINQSVDKETPTFINHNDLSEQVALKISITNIEKNSEYKIESFSIIDGLTQSLNIMETCNIDNKTKTAILKTSILMRYYFEKEQKIKFIINKSGSNTKELKFVTTLGCVMGSRNTTLIKEIPESDGEIINICGEKMNDSEEILIVDFKLKTKHSNIINYSDTKNKLIYNISDESNRPIYNSESLNDNGTWNIVKIPSGLLNKGIILKFLNYNRKVILQINTTIPQLIDKQQFILKLGLGRTVTCISNSKVAKDYTFVDYLKAGVQIGLNIAIDFTASNKDPNDPKSLHYIAGLEPNQYERAIYSCGNIMAYYDYDQLFPCYGFGAKMGDKPCPLFNLNFQYNPNIHTINNIIKEYHNALSTVKLWGPTQFGPIIKATCDMIKEENNFRKYQVLMILTDGMIDDMDYTIDQLVEGSFLPLSIIIIGVGKTDFSMMTELDSDEKTLVDSNKRKSVRDLVQFVPFLKYEANPEKLAQEVLAEIPRQIIQFYQQNDLDPMKISTQ